LIRGAVLAAAIAAAVAACGGGGGSVPDRFSGTWRLDDGRSVTLRRVGRDEGEQALRALRGTPCSGTAIYFRATYFSGRAHLAGCATGDGRRVVGRFDDNGIRGRIVQRLVRDDPPTFRAEIDGDGAAPFTVTAVRRRS